MSPQGLACLSPRLGEAAAHGVKENLRRRAAAQILRPLLDYDVQRDICKSLRDNAFTAVDGTRRAGKTEIFRWLLAMCVLRDDYVVRVIATLLSAPAQNWILRESGSAAPGKPRMGNALEILSECGLDGCFSVERPGPSLVKKISFSWGSSIYIHPIDNLRALGNRRGFRAHFYWIDEAQSMRLLGEVLLQLILPTLQDFGGHLLLSGTPSDHVDTLFGRLMTKRKSGDGWHRFKLSIWRNPFMGPDPGARWQNAIRTYIRPAQQQYQLTESQLAWLSSLTPDQLDRIANRDYADDLERVMVEGGKHGGVEYEGLHEDLRREGIGQWCQGGAHYVFSWHKVPPHRRYWCALSERDGEHSGFDGPVLPNLSDRVAALPTVHLQGREVAHDWRVLVAVDYGFFPDPATWLALAWATTCEQAYVLHTRKEWHLDDDEMLARTVEFVGEIRSCNLRVQLVVADLNGTRRGTQAKWDRDFRARYPRGLPVVLPKKHDKDQQIKVLNLDVTAGRILLVCGDDLDFEALNLQRKPYSPTRAHEAGMIDKHREVYDRDGRKVIPGDHALDCLRYLVPHCGVLGAQTPQDEPPPEQQRQLAISRFTTRLAKQRFAKT